MAEVRAGGNRGQATLLPVRTRGKLSPPLLLRENLGPASQFWLPVGGGAFGVT